MNFDWLKNIKQNLDDVLQYGSIEAKEKQELAQQEATKRMNSEQEKANKQAALEEKKLYDYYQKLKKEELDKIKLEKEKLTLIEKIKQVFGGKEEESEVKGESVTPTPTPATTTPGPEKIEEFLIDYAPYIADQGKIDAYYPNGIPQPPSELLDIIRKVSPEDATRSAILKLTESGYNMNPADYNGNKNGTIDRGTNMINSGTFDWLQGTPYNTMMEKSGIENYGDMFDPMKNENMMDVIRKAQGYGAWYGPRDKGFKHGL